MHINTRAVHQPRPSLGDSIPVSMPIYQSSVFAFDDPSGCAEGLSGPGGSFAYGRYGNPTVRALEDAVTALEGGSAALACGSGMGAISTVMLGLLKPGDHVIAQTAIYGGTYALFHDLSERFGIEVTYLEPGQSVASAQRPSTRVLYLETISNPMTEVVDLPGLFAEGSAAGLINVVDSTFATPILCRPLELGADVVIHSTTKYLSGHDDVIGGIAVFASESQYEHVWKFSTKLGAVADPFSAWLTLRGLKTLALRMREQCSNAAALAQRLASHPAVAAVHYPGLESHPSHETAAKVLGGGYGAIVAFDLVGGRDAGRDFMKRARLAYLATTLGGVETLMLHPASTSHASLSSEELAAMGIGEGTVRLSVGIEDVEDLWADLVQALLIAAPPRRG